MREIYERAVAQVPPGDEKRHWRRYIFTWLNYAVFEELETKVYISPFYLHPIQMLIFCVVLFCQIGSSKSKRNLQSRFEVGPSQAIYVCQSVDSIC